MCEFVFGNHFKCKFVFGNILCANWDKCFLEKKKKKTNSKTRSEPRLAGKNLQIEKLCFAKSNSEISDVMAFLQL